MSNNLAERENIFRGTVVVLSCTGFASALPRSRRFEWTKKGFLFSETRRSFAFSHHDVTMYLRLPLISAESS